MYKQLSAQINILLVTAVLAIGLVLPVTPPTVTGDCSGSIGQSCGG
ncbi:MAG: hypothetical protein WAS33_19540 [Candidatus Promineifilaceae bacterium]|nr:hypothetical protein [Anaerolineaceae bacterium]